MMVYDLNTLFELIFPNVNFRLLLIITATSFLTWWLLLGILNRFIRSFFTIATCAAEAVIEVFFTGLARLSQLLEKILILPKRNGFQMLHLPFGLTILLLFTLGLAVLTLDHLYGKQLFLSNETVRYYHIEILDQSYWVSEYALGFVGILAGYIIITVGISLLAGILNPLSQSVRKSIVVRK